MNSNLKCHCPKFNIKSISILILSLAIWVCQPNLKASANELAGDYSTMTSIESMESESLLEGSQPVDQTEKNSNSKPISANAQTVAFLSYLPYANYLNYQYLGESDAFTTKDIIMEYMPDENRIFQVAEFTEKQAVAHVYQIREDGLYLLGTMDNYQTVEDLRYSPMATDEQESLILPANLNPGSTYQSGFHKEKSMQVIGFIDSVTIGTSTYQNVLMIEEHSSELPANTILTYYLADKVGIVLVQEKGPDGSFINTMYLNNVQVPIN